MVTLKVREVLKDRDEGESHGSLRLRLVGWSCEAYVQGWIVRTQDGGAKTYDIN